MLLQTARWFRQGSGLALVALLLASSACAAASDAPAQASSLTLGEQAMSYGGGVEWVMDAEDGCRIYVREYGDPAAPAWLVLHGGWGAEHSYLLDAFAGLENEFRLVFYDQRGSLRSPCDPDKISLQAHIDDVDRLRRALGADRIHLVGHSMGAHLASRYLLAHPGRVGRLVLLGPGLPKVPFDEEEWAIARGGGQPWASGATNEFELFQASAQWMGDRPAVAAELRAHGLDNQQLADLEATFAWRVRFAAVNLFHVDRWPRFRGGYPFYSEAAGQRAAMDMGRHGPWDFPAAWRTHDQPVTVILGDHDFTDMGARLMRHWLAGQERVRLVVVEDAGHNAWLDAPEAVRDALLQGMR